MKEITEKYLGEQLYSQFNYLKGLRQFESTTYIFKIANERYFPKNIEEKRIHQGFLRNLYKQGFTDGLPDYIVQTKRVIGYLELKRNFKSNITESQKLFKTRCEEYHPYLLTHKVDEALHFIKQLEDYVRLS
jgi:hypothetical protein